MSIHAFSWGKKIYENCNQCKYSLKREVEKNKTRAWSYKQKITENFQKIWPNFLFSGNSYRFPNFVPIKNFWQFFSGICPASCTKKSCQKFFWFPRKKLMVQNFLVFLKNVSFSQKNFQTREFMFIGLSPVYNRSSWSTQFLGKKIIRVRTGKCKVKADAKGTRQPTFGDL